MDPRERIQKLLEDEVISSDEENGDPEEYIDKVVEMFSNLDIPVKDRDFTADQKIHFICDIAAKLKHIDDVESLPEKIALFESILGELDLSDHLLTECARIVNDCTEYPYFGEERSGKYNFEHNGRRCVMIRSNQFWRGKVYIKTGSLCDVMSLPDPRFNVHNGIDGIGVNHLGFTCYGDNDISGMIQAIEIAMKPDGIHREYRDYDYVKKELEKLADLVNVHLSEYC